MLLQNLYLYGSKCFSISHVFFQTFLLRTKHMFYINLSKKFIDRSYYLNPVFSKTCLKRPLSKRPKFSFQDLLLLNAGHKYCRMLQRERSAVLLTRIKLPIVTMIFVMSIFEWPLKTGFTAYNTFFVELLSKTLNPLLSTDLTKEDPSRHD